jgi:hypothetical protein
MKTFILLMSLSAGLAQGIHAQSFCASDGQSTPVLLLERFISADCKSCWSAPPDAQPTNGALTLDWIVPSDHADEAPLSAAANRDALLRLETLGQSAPKTQLQTSHPVDASRSKKLRVAHGLAFGGYIGASIELKSDSSDKRLPQAKKELNAYLVLVESIPAGSEGTPIARNLVRNVLLLQWNQRAQLPPSEQIRFYELRPLNIPQGASPERLRVLGWVQDASGHVLSAAQSVCAEQSR